MSNTNYITKILNLKDNNINFKENFYNEIKIKGITHKVFEGYLTYKPDYCYKCGVIFDNKFEKHGFVTSNIKIPDISGYKAILKLHKQRYLCNHCHKAFTLKTNVVEYGCNISNNTKHKIANDLTKKLSEKDIALNNNVSSNTVERIIDSYYEPIKLYKHFLPTVLSFDEFKSVKSAKGAMSFHMCNGETGKTIDIIEDRRLCSLMKYFSYFSHKARNNVKFIVIDMYAPYVSLIQKLFPNAKIIIDKFHLIQLISRSLNKTRIMVMKKDKSNYNKLKRYWKLLLKSKDELNYSYWKKYTCFKHFLTESDLVNLLVNSNKELKATYDIYQLLLESIKSNNYSLFINTINSDFKDVSSYMITSLKTLRKYSSYIKHTLNNPYHNGYIEGNNNFIKVIKRIAFGFRSFRRFKARIMILKGLLVISKKKINAYTH